MPGPAESALAVTQIKSGIGSKPKHRGTLRALGLGKVGKTHVLPDRPEIRGMLATVTHLVTFQPVDVGEAVDAGHGAGVRTNDQSGENQ